MRHVSREWILPGIIPAVRCQTGRAIQRLGWWTVSSKVGRPTMRLWLLALFAPLGVVLCGCGGADPPTASIPATVPSAATVEQDASQTPVGSVPPKANSLKLQMAFVFERGGKAMGEVVVELDREKAPNTVHNFYTNYVARQIFDNSIAHYVDERMLLVGGFGADRQPTETFGEIRNESDNGSSNVRGTIAMSRDPEYPDSATSQFFFNLADNSSLDHQSKEGELSVGGNGYCVFGKVISGMDILDELAKTPTEDVEGFVNFPSEPIVIRSVQRATTP